MMHVTGAPHLQPVAIGTLSALLWPVDALAREENERVQLHDGAKLVIDGGMTGGVRPRWS